MTSKPSNTAVDKGKKALSIIMTETVPEAEQLAIRQAGVSLGITVALSTTVQETVELAAFSPRVIVICASTSREQLVHEVTICKLLAARIKRGSARIHLLMAPDMSKLASSLSRYGFTDITSAGVKVRANDWTPSIEEALKTLIEETQLKIETEETAPAPLANSQTGTDERPATRVRHLSPLNHASDFWITSRVRGTEPQRIAAKWRIALKGPAPTLGGWFSTPPPASCLQPPHDQEAGWWEWRFRDDPVTGHGKSGLNPDQFEYSKYRWIAHGVEPWLQNGLWRFSGSYPLLALVEGKGPDARLIGLRFIARSETLLDITYDSSLAPMIEPAIDAGLEALSEDVLRVRTIDPSHFNQRTSKKPDAGSFLSTLQAAFPEGATPEPEPESHAPQEAAAHTILGPARFLRRHNAISEFELHWLYSEWLIDAGFSPGKAPSPEALLSAQAQVSIRLQEFARELLEDLHPDLDLEIWQESDSGHDHLRRVDPALTGDSLPSHSPELSFDALLGIPGVTGFSHRAQRGSSDRARPLGAALIFRRRVQQTGKPQTEKPKLDPRLVPILQRITAFLAQSLPPVLDAERSGISLSAKKAA